jgi:2-polyprenyl-3-methyl-5-hydroxy-6-metoxy-1,4-benzoquinol methylase
MTENQQSRDSQLDPVRETFEEFGRADPMYAALTRSECRGGKWDAAEFFANGRAEIASVMAYMDGLGVPLARGRALDFGCGIGRLTQALAGHFQEVVGVDIASSMVEAARAHNQHGDRVRYLHNTRSDLHLLESSSFDFVYSNKVLQHIPPEAQSAYIKEFVRVLRPNGLAIFQTRNGPRIRPGTPRAWLYTLNRRYIRRLTQRVKGRAPYEMHYIAQSTVEELVGEAGGRVVDIVDLSQGKPRRSLRYSVRR